MQMVSQLSHKYHRKETSWGFNDFFCDTSTQSIVKLLGLPSVWKKLTDMRHCGGHLFSGWLLMCHGLSYMCIMNRYRNKVASLWAERRENRAYDTSLRNHFDAWARFASRQRRVRHRQDMVEVGLRRCRVLPVLVAMF